MRRVVPLLVIVGLLVAALAVDRADRTDREARRRRPVGEPTAGSDAGPVRAARAAMAVTDPVDGLSSTWYCAGGTATAGGAADLVVVVANPGRRPLDAVVTAVPLAGPEHERSVAVPAGGRVRVRVQDLVDAPYVAAQVEVSGGGVAVEREVTGPSGYDASPCASSPSSRWYFAAGSTLRGAEEVLAVFNPFPSDAVVDIDFATDSGPRRPRALQALPVPGRSLQIVRVNDVVTRRAVLATRVRVRSGRLVVDRLQTFDGQGDPVAGADPTTTPTPPPRGLAVTTGISGPRSAWAFPAGRKLTGARERIVVYNPSERDAEIDVHVTLEQPEVNGRLDPLPLSVPSGDVRVFDVTDQATVPNDVDHSIDVRSTNGVDVVAELELSAGPPWPRVGVAMVAGSPLEATRWLFAAGGSVPPAMVQRIVVRNPGPEPATVRVAPLAGGGPGTTEVTVPAGGRATVPFDDVTTTELPVEVRASRPVVAERAVYFGDRPGLSFAMGVPVAEEARAVR